MGFLKRVVAVMAAIGVGSTWYLAAAQLDRGVLDLVPFTASGSVLGLFIGWLAHAANRPRFTWNRALVGALVGAVVLPPWLGSLIAITGANPSRLLALFTTGAWVALAAGLLAALMFAGPGIRRRSTDLIRSRRGGLPDVSRSAVEEPLARNDHEV